MDTWHERISSFDQVLPTGLGRGKEGIENREKRRDFRERVSNFSLDFSEIRPALFGKTRSKVDPHCKSYAWVPILWSFDKIREVGVFSYLV